MGALQSFAYEVGEIATNNVITSVRLVVIDKARTEELRRSEALRLPPVFRYDREIFELSKGRLSAACARMRERFQEELKGEFGKKVLSDEEAQDPAFRSLVSSFQARHPSFPLTTELAKSWATGKWGQPVQGNWANKLRQTMNSYIRADTLPAGSWGTAQVITNADAPTVLQSVPKRRLITRAQARQNLGGRFPADQQAIARFVGEFIEENCVFLPELTEKSRAETLKSVWQAKQYQPGEILVRAGEKVDDQAKAAIDELSKALAIAAPPGRPTSNRIFYLSGFLLLMSIGCLGGCWSFLYRKRARALLPAVAEPGPVSSADDPWLERALLADRNTRQLAHQTRATLVPKFIHWLKSHAVQQLLSQREELLSTQKLAEMELARLERMLAEIHAPLEERLKFYERRIAELEQTLAAKGEESRELIQTMIRLTRSKLENERKSGEGVTWN